MFFEFRGETVHQMRRYSLLWYVIGLLVLVISIPWNMSMPTAKLDPSWQMAIHYAYAHGMQFGRDVVFTFGPLGFLWLPQYYPDHYYTMLAFWASLALIFLMVVYYLSASGNKIQISVQCILGYTILTVGVFIKDAILFSYFALLLIFVLDQRKKSSAVRAGLTVGLISFAALIGLEKFTGLILAVATLILLDFHLMMMRRVPRYSIFFAVLFVLFAVSVGKQEPSSILPYLQHSWIVASGYSQAMQISKSFAKLCVYLLVVSTFVVFSALIECKEKRFDLTSFTRWLGLLLVLFMSFKEGHVRQDGHIERSWATLVFVLAIYSTYFFRHFPQKAYQLVFCAIAMLAVVPTIYIRAHLTYLEVVDRDVMQRLRTAKEVLFHGKEYQDAAYAAALTQIKHSFPLQSVISLDESVDIYPSRASVLIANQLNYRPRPLLQSYQAYTGRLAALDRDYLYSDKAPERLLFRVGSIDGRYPGMDDGYSWPDILSLYDSGGKTSEYIILKRRVRPRTLSYEKLERKAFVLGENIKLPFVDGSDGYLQASIDLHLTVLGAIMKTLYKTPEMYMAITRKDGSRLKYRLIVDVLSKGMIISPIVNHLPAWEQMITGLGKRRMNAGYIPESVTFSGGGWFCYFYDCNTMLDLKRLRISN